MNLFHADVVDGGVKFGTATVDVDRDAIASASGPIVTIGVRPEDIVSNVQGEGLGGVVVDLVEELGADGYLYGHSTIEGKRTDIVARVDGRVHPYAGDSASSSCPRRSTCTCSTPSRGARLLKAPVVT